MLTVTGDNANKVNAEIRISDNYTGDAFLKLTRDGGNSFELFATVEEIDALAEYLKEFSKRHKR